MNLVLAVRDRLGVGSVQTALEFAAELRRRGHRILHDEGDYAQAWEGADAALCHADDPARLVELSRLHRVPLVLLARYESEVAALDPRRFKLLVIPSRAAFKQWDSLTLVVPPLVPVSFWRVCPHRDPDCLCPRTGVCRYENDLQTEYEAPAPPSAATTVTLVGGDARHGAGVFYEIARRLPGRSFTVVRHSRGVPLPSLPNLTAVGSLDPDGLRRLYARTRLLLMLGPQTAGRPALEAGASHIPTVAAPSPGARETLGDAPVWASPERLKDWLTVIRALDEPGFYRDRADAAYLLAASRSRSVALDRLEAALAKGRSVKRT